LFRKRERRGGERGPATKPTGYSFLSGGGKKKEGKSSSPKQLKRKIKGEKSIPTTPEKRKPILRSIFISFYCKEGGGGGRKKEKDHKLPMLEKRGQGHFEVPPSP